MFDITLGQVYKSFLIVKNIPIYIRQLFIIKYLCESRECPQLVNIKFLTVRLLIKLVLSVNIHSEYLVNIDIYTD